MQRLLTEDWQNFFFCLLNHDCTCMSVGLYFFSMLVNVYGSKDLFVSEYRTLLADRILSSFNYDTEKEVIACTLLFVYQFIKLFSMWGITSTDFCKFKFSQFSQKICAFWAPSFSNCLFCFKSLAMEIFGFWTYLKLTCSFSNSLESNCSHNCICGEFDLYCVQELDFFVFISLHFSYIIKFFIFSLQLRYLELLKLRFGESHLHFCEIMLKDVADSRRINSHIQASAAKNENTKVQYMEWNSISTHSLTCLNHSWLYFFAFSSLTAVRFYSTDSYGFVCSVLASI